MIDDGTSIFAENLLDITKNLSSNELHFSGWMRYIDGCVIQGVPDHRFAHGGSGMLVSHEAALRVSEIKKECLKLTSHCWAGDMRLSACLAYIGASVNSVDHPWGYYIHDWRAGSSRYNNPDVGQPEFWFPALACARPTTSHRLRF